MINILDRVVVVVALGGLLIRMGNLFNSEIYGIETTLPWGFIFVRAGETVPKHPTQIYEGLAALLIFFTVQTICFKAQTIAQRCTFWTVSDIAVYYEIFRRVHQRRPSCT